MPTAPFRFRAQTSRLRLGLNSHLKACNDETTERVYEETTELEKTGKSSPAPVEETLQA